jgi:hypothetical protein
MIIVGCTAQIFIWGRKRLIAETTWLVRHQESSSVTHCFRVQGAKWADRDTTRQFFLLAQECPYRKKDMFREFMGHYHSERNHQGLGNRLIAPEVYPFDERYQSSGGSD